MPFVVLFLTLLISGTVTKCSKNRGRVQLLSDGSPYVQLQHGVYFGTTLTSRQGKSYHAFQGIRYAATPKRFEKSFPLSNLETMPGPVLAQSLGSECPQTSRDGQKFIGQNDCLFGNFYIPQGDPADEDGFPVIVFIHPGSFKSGSGGAYSAKYFMDERVIFANFNFRLGLIGFMGGGESLPSNIGLRDQITFLEWVAEHIEGFGGNKKRITIAGTESGAASVQYLLLSTSSRGLFQSAIMHGGSATASFLPASSGTALAKLVSDRLECPFQPSSDLLADCMKTKRLRDLLEIQRGVSEKYFNFTSPFLPSVDYCSRARHCTDSFLSYPPALLLSQRKYKRVPLLIGMNYDVPHQNASLGPSRTRLIHNNFFSSLPTFPQFDEETFLGWLHTIIGHLPDFPYTGYSKFHPEIQRLYFKNVSSISNSSSLMLHHRLNDFFYDALIAYGSWKFAMTYAHDKPVYPYIITFPMSGGNSGFHENPAGEAFADGTEFLTPSLLDLNEFDSGSDKEIFSQHLVHLWATFATHQKPVDVWQTNETWMPLSVAQLNGEKPVTWYALDKEVKLIHEPFTKKMKFWDRLFKESEEVIIS